MSLKWWRIFIWIGGINIFGRLLRIAIDSYSGRIDIEYQLTHLLLAAVALIAFYNCRPAKIEEGMNVLIDYTNHAGIRATRRILPISIRFAATEWHREPQWLLLAKDLDKGVNREFAINDIHSWVPTK